MKKNIVRNLLCAGLIIGSVITGAPQALVYAQEPSTTLTSQDPENQGDSEVTDDMLEGAVKDLVISNYSVSGGNAGGKTTINFTVTSNSAISSNVYDVANIKRVFANVDENSPFETNDESARVTPVNATTANISYSFTTKDNVETTYYPVSFTIVYGRSGKKTIRAEQKQKIDIAEYYITKNFSVKLTAKPEEKKEEKKEAEASDTDVSISVKDAPFGKYGEKCKVGFTVESKSCKIINVAPVISDSFPFETKGDAYKNITSKGTNSIKCAYDFVVRSDVATGYQGVTFAVTYVKDDKTFSVNKSINVKLEGKKEKTETPAGGGDKKTSVPRLMVVGCDTNLDTIYPNDVFVLTVHLKNTAKQAVSNIKVTLASEEKNFISTNGASSAYVDSIAAGATADVKFELQADSSLGAKSYGLNVKTEYEDLKANSFTSEDSLTISVSLKSDLKITDLQVPYDLYVGTDGTLSFTITNTGASTLYNVNVKCEGNDFSCEETYVGNITSGNTGYATINLTGQQVTTDEGLCSIVVTYEDNKGNKSEITEQTNVSVSEYVEVTEDVNTDEDVDAEQKTVIWPYIVGGIVVVAIVVFCVIRIIKKRKQTEEELMEDDI